MKNYRLYRIVYEFVLALLALVLLPKILFQYFVKGKYKGNFKQRFGIGFPDIQKKDRLLYWIHAVSLGETKAVAPIAKRIKKEDPSSIVLISSITQTGHAEAKKAIPEADYHVYMPLDFSWIIRPIVKRTAPDTIILCETDFWLNFLTAAKAGGAQMILVNGKLSEKTTNRYLKFRRFASFLFSLFDLICVQSKHYFNRFYKVGAPAQNLIVTGNLKYDAEFPIMKAEEKTEWKQRLGISTEDLVLVLGSTHGPEEEIILDSLKTVWDKFPNLKVMIVPRHPERFDEVASLIEQQKIPYFRYSRFPLLDARVLLIDQMGVLNHLYQLADIALVAGSYKESVGGHNILEPIRYGVPVLFGPYMQGQPEMLELVLNAKAGLQVAPEILAKTLIHLLENEQLRNQIGAAGLGLTQELKGSVERTWNTMRPFINATA